MKVKLSSLFENADVVRIDREVQVDHHSCSATGEPPLVCSHRTLNGGVYKFNWEQSVEFEHNTENVELTTVEGRKVSASFEVFRTLTPRDFSEHDIVK